MCTRLNCSLGRKTNLPPKLQGEIDKFLSPFRSEQFLDKIVERSKDDRDALAYSLRVNLNEVYVGVDLIHKDLSSYKPSKILEIGAGLKLVSYFLKSQGYDVTAVEPIQTGFGFYKHAGELIQEHFNDITLPTLNIYAEELDSKIHGQYDYIFSINVMEHIHEFEKAISSLNNVLNKNGVMRHTCPNYTIPYEVHLGIPLIPLKPILTRYLAPKIVKENQEMWDSLNFITQPRVVKALRKVGLNAKFRKGLTYDAFSRLGNDEVFGERHDSTIAGKIYKFLTTFKILGLVKHLPLRYTSPMEFITQKI